MFLKNGVMQNHHLTSVSTSPKKTARQFFLTQKPIWDIKYTMLSIALTASQLYFLYGLAFGSAAMLLVVLVIILVKNL